MLPEEIQHIEEKEPPISKECYNIYSTTPQTLKQIATLKNIKYNTIKHYNTYYKYKKRMEYYKISKPKQSGSNKKPHHKEAVKKKYKKNKKQPKQYQVYTYEHTLNLLLILTPKELKQLEKQSKKKGYTTKEDYIITILDTYYEQIGTNKILGYPERLQQIKQEENNIRHITLTHPKLLEPKDYTITDRQTVIEDYY